MGSIGLPELIVLALVVAVASAPFVLRKKLPDRLPVGLPLAFFLGPWGHWYLKGGATYVLALAVANGLLDMLLPSARLAWLGLCVVSTLAMYYRLRLQRRLEFSE
jgi:hypothetical protein